MIGGGTLGRVTGWERGRVVGGVRRWAGVANWIVMELLAQFVEYDCIDVNSDVLGSYLVD